MQKSEYKNSDIIAGMQCAETITFSVPPTTLEQALLQLTKLGNRGMYLLSRLKNEKCTFVVECFSKKFVGFEYGLINGLSNQFRKQGIYLKLVEEATQIRLTFHVIDLDVSK